MGQSIWHLLDDLANKCHPGVFVANVLTGVQSVKQAQDVVPCDSLFVSVLTGERLPSVGDVVYCAPKEPKTKLPGPADPLPLTRKSLISAKEGDPSLAKCFVFFSVPFR